VQKVWMSCPRDFRREGESSKRASRLPAGQRIPPCLATRTSAVQLGAQLRGSREGGRTASATLDAAVECGDGLLPREANRSSRR
jgi:hypothetical protein